ncbi:MAG: hypothetical protein JOS17DRAFT_756478 [Linnemannia elongata]|nr:MAG: hypothetical protein JOS17DRAFT_756478 [Linnemannia elongata]
MLSSYPPHSHTIQDKPTILTYTTSKRKISPLDIPEILESILSYVRGSTLTRTAILVCRQWFLTVRHRLIRQTDWDSIWPSEELDKVLTRIPTTTRLRCSFAKPTSAAAGDDNVKKLWKVLEDHHLKYRKHGRQPAHHQDPRSKKQRSGEGMYFSPGVAKALESTTLRDLVVEGYVHHYTILPHGLPGLSSLRVLKIHTKQEATFHMSNILGALPELEVLHIRSICALDLSEHWIQSIGDRYSKRLRSLVLVNALVHQSSLEDLLSTSPCLKELQLMVCRFPGRNAPSFEMKRFYNFFQSFLTDLEVFQFGNDSIVPIGEESDDEEGEENGELRAELGLMLSGCLKSKDWTFFGHKWPGHLIESLLSFPNRVTTLEILGPCDALHDFLCDSPQLLHVKAPWATVQPHYMDLHLCWDHGDGRMINFGCSTLSNAPKIWACRGLQTLHIGARFYDRYVPGYNDYSLYLFGYIARVCPMLQDLALFGPESKPTSRGSLSTSDTLRLDLAGGLCLLSHLTYLQYLRIGELYVKPFVKPIDVEWILPLGHSADKKQERAEVIARWSTSILRDRELQQQQKMPYEPQLSGLPLEIPGLEPELKKNLRYLGHKMDVIETLAGMDEQEGFVCWAELDRISIYGRNGFGQSLEKEVGRLVAPPVSAIRSSPPRPQDRPKSFFQRIKATFSDK